MPLEDALISVTPIVLAALEAANQQAPGGSIGQDVNTALGIAGAALIEISRRTYAAMSGEANAAQMVAALPRIANEYLSDNEIRIAIERDNQVN